MASKKIADTGYQQWLADLKEKIRGSQMRAALKVNTEMLALYWEIGKELTEKQDKAGWGDKIITQLATDLRMEFPDIKGFSRSNIFNIAKWYRFYSANSALVQQAVGLIKNPGQQAVDQTVQQAVGLLPGFLGRVPWGHHIQIITKVTDIAGAVFYVQQTAVNNWSRAVLQHQIESDLYRRKGKAITNFELTLPKAHSDLARETLKNPYIFDFLGLTDDVQERELEKALIQHIKKFMLELGRGFAYVGNQYNLKVEDDEYFLDLLFFNYQLDCFVVFELKVGEFKPEFTGKLNFYINTIDGQIKAAHHKPTIGVLLCKTPNETVVQYALKGIDTPMGVAEYEFTNALPKQLKGEMPTIEELEAELEKETLEFKEQQNPVDARLQAIKEKLKGIKTEEIQTTANYEILLHIFISGLRPLYEQIIKKFSSDFGEEYMNHSYYWRCNSQVISDIDSLQVYWEKKENQEQTREIEFTYRFEGFKKGGAENNDQYLILNMYMAGYWYEFMLNGYNNQQPFLKKLYHQAITKEDRQQITDLMMTKVMDRIEWILEAMKKKEGQTT